MPRYNRSADVRAGYFDSQITGFGKVPANRTRFQNSRVTRTVEQGWRPGGGDRPEREGSKDTGTTQSSGGQSGGAPATPKVNLSDQRAADLALVHHLITASHFGPNWTYKGTTPEFYEARRNQPMDRSWMNVPEHPDYNGFARPYSDYEGMSDDELHAAAEKLNKINQRDPFISVPKEIQAKYDAKGGALPLRKPAEIQALIADRPDDFDPEFSEDLDFGFPAGKGQDHYKSVYLNDQGIRKFINNGKLPVNVADPEMPEMSADLVDEELDRLMQANEQGRTGTNHIQNILTALMAKQLHRYYHRATGGGGGSVPPRQILPNGGGNGGAAQPVMGAGAFSGALPAGGQLYRLGDIVIPRYTGN